MVSICSGLPSSCLLPGSTAAIIQCQICLLQGARQWDPVSELLWAHHHCGHRAGLPAVLWHPSSEIPGREALSLLWVQAQTCRGESETNHWQRLAESWWNLEELLFGHWFLPQCCLHPLLRLVRNETLCGRRPPPFRASWKLCWTLELMTTNSPKMQRFTLISILSFLVFFFYFLPIVWGPHFSGNTRVCLWFRHLTGSSVQISEVFFIVGGFFFFPFFAFGNQNFTVFFSFWLLNQTLLILICIFSLSDTHSPLSLL